MATIYTINNKVLKKDGKWLIQDPYNPLGLPPLTIRVKWQSGYTPSISGGTNTLVDAENNIYDITVNSSMWRQRFQTQTRLLEVIGANTKDVTDIRQCFSGCNKVTSICSLDLTGLTESSITRLFDGCSTLTSIGNIKVKPNFITSTNQLFYNCKVLTSVPLFDTSAVTDMTGMFHTCQALTSIPQFDTTSLTTVTTSSGTGMFRGCSSLTSIPYINTSSVTNISYLFYGCSSLTSIPNINTSSVTIMSSLFQGCSSLTSIPLLNTTNVTRMNSLFNGCTSITTVPLLDTTNATNVSNMFYNCTNVESGALALYNQMSTQTVPPSTHSQTFTNCGANTTTGAAELAQIPYSWGGTA